MLDQRLLRVVGVGSLLLGFSAAWAAESGQIDLATAVRMGLEHSWSLKAAQATVEEAEARYLQGWAGVSPHLSAEWLSARNSADVNKAIGKSFGGPPIPDRINKASVTLAQPLLGLLSGGARVQALHAAQRAAESDRSAMRIQTVFAVAEAFLNTRKAQRMVEIADASVKAAEEQQRSGEVLLRAGKMTDSDRFRLDAALSEALLQRVKLTAARDTALFALAEMLGLQGGEPLLLADTPPLEVNRAVPQPMAAVAEALQDRPELHAAEARLDGVQAQAFAAKADLLPSLNAFVKFERNFEQDGLTTPPMHVHANGAVVNAPTETLSAEDTRDNLSFGLAMQWEIWDGGMRWGRAWEGAVAREKAVYAREQLAAQIRVEAAQAAQDLRHFSSALKFAISARTSAEEAYRQQSLRFTHGLANVTDLTSAERDLTRARGNDANSQADLELAWLRYWRVVGLNPLEAVDAVSRTNGGT